MTIINIGIQTIKKIAFLYATIFHIQVNFVVKIWSGLDTQRNLARVKKKQLVFLAETGSVHIEH